MGAQRRAIVRQHSTMRRSQQGCAHCCCVFFMWLALFLLSVHMIVRGMYMIRRNQDCAAMRVDYRAQVDREVIMADAVREESKADSEFAGEPREVDSVEEPEKTPEEPKSEEKA